MSETIEVQIDNILNRLAVELAVKDEALFEAEKRAKFKLLKLLESQKLKAEPQLENLYELHLPAINRYTDSVPNRENIPLYIRKEGRAKKIVVKHRLPVNTNQVCLV